MSMFVRVVGDYEIRILDDYLIVFRGEEDDQVCFHVVDGLGEFVERNEEMLSVRLESDNALFIFSRDGSGWMQFLDQLDASHWRVEQGEEKQHGR